MIWTVTAATEKSSSQPQNIHLKTVQKADPSGRAV